MEKDENGAARVARYRAAIREQALDRFLSEALAPDAREWVAGFSARAAVAVADEEHAALVAEVERWKRDFATHTEAECAERRPEGGSGVVETMGTLIESVKAKKQARDGSR